MRRSEIEQGTATRISEVVVKRLRKRNWKTKRRMSLRQTSKHLSDMGYLNERGNPYSTQSISDMIKLIIPLLICLILLFFGFIRKEKRKRLIRICLIIFVISFIGSIMFLVVKRKFWDNAEEEKTQQQTID